MSVAAAVGALLDLGADGAHPASAVVGLRRGDEVDVAVGGWARLPGREPGVSMDRSLLIDVASVTKVAVTTVLAMRLVAEGRLDLAAPARELLPDLAMPGAEAITLERLLSHTAGLRPWWPLYFDARDRDEALLLAQRVPLAAEPGAAFAYSDLSFILAGAAVERAAGMPLPDAFRALVAEPLGLRARYGPVPAAEAATSADSDAWEHRMVATGEPYPSPHPAEDFGGWRRVPIRGEVHDGNAAHALGGVSGHAGLFATIDDLLALGAALGAGDLVPREVLERFARPTSVDPTRAVGLRLLELPGAAGAPAPRLLWHGGFTGTMLGFSPDVPLVVAGAAMRLHGTIGPIRASAALRAEPVSGIAVNEVLHDLARRAAARRGSSWSG